MKTLFVLCSLATIAIAVPTSLRKNFDSFELSSENIPGNRREKKSTEHDSSQELTINDEKENTQMRHSHKTKIETSSPGKTKVNFRKPIIIKKKFGYHVYRDSDEEMAHADPHENCIKQFKVKLCDGEPTLQTHSNHVKSLMSESRDPESISEKEMENSIKMAKAAVQNLERGLQQIEHTSGIKSDSRESLDSGITLQQDIEMAKSALDHIQRKMGNLEAIDFPVNKRKTEDIKSINEWKEAIDNINKNAEISKNIDDAFNFQTQHFQQSDNINVPRTNENEQSEDPSKEKHNNNMNIEHPSNSRSSTTKDEHEIHENDMYVASTNHKESEVLRGESLITDNDFNLKSLDSGDHTKHYFNGNHFPVITENSEILPTDSDIQNTEMINTDMPEEKVAGDIKTTTLQRSDDENPKIGLSVESFTNTENSASAQLTKEDCEEEQQHEEQKHGPVLKSGEQIINQSETEVKTTETATGNLHPSDPKTTLLKENEEKNKDLSNQKYIEASESKPLASANLDKNKESDVTKAHNLHSFNVNHENAHLSSLTTAESGNGQQLPNEFPSLRMDENHNTNHLLNVNIEDQLNDFHQSFMRLAQEKQLNDMLLQQLNNIEHSDNEHKINLHAKTNEFVPTEDINAHMVHIHDTVPLGIHENQHFMAMPSIPNNRQMDQPPQHMKSVIDLPNDDTSLTSVKTNILKNVENSFNGHPNMRLVEGISIDNMDHDKTETQHFNNPLWAERWAQENQQGSHAFKTMSELNNMDMLLTPTNNNEFHNEHHAHTENMNTNMRTMEGLLTDSNEMNDPHSMRLAQDKHYTHDLAQTFNTAAEYHNKAQWNNHFHESTPTNALNNFGFNGNQDLYPMRSGMPDHFHLMKHAQAYDVDSAMQPSMQMGMKDSNTQWGYHHHHHNPHHHSMSRSGYYSSHPNSDSSMGAVGVFSNANTGSAIPLLLSCSPSVVSGSLARAHPRGISYPAYRTGENLMRYIKRDANKIEEKQSVKILKKPITLKQ